jgi:hypothetical protein
MACRGTGVLAYSVLSSHLQPSAVKERLQKVCTLERMRNRCDVEKLIDTLVAVLFRKNILQTLVNWL